MIHIQFHLLKIGYLFELRWGYRESIEFISTIHLRFKIYLDGFFTSNIQLPYPHIQDISSNSTCIFNYRLLLMASFLGPIIKKNQFFLAPQKLENQNYIAYAKLLLWPNMPKLFFQTGWLIRFNKYFWSEKSFCIFFLKLLFRLIKICLKLKLIFF